MHSKLVCRNYKSGDYIIWHTKKDDHIYVLWNQASHHLCEEYSCKQLEASILAWHGPIGPCFRPGWAGLVNHRHEKHQAILARPDRPAEPGQTHILCTFLILSFLTFIKFFLLQFGLMGRTIHLDTFTSIKHLNISYNTPGKKIISKEYKLHASYWSYKLQRLFVLCLICS